MSRGDQRDRDRAKNQAKQAAKLKAQSKGGDPLKRNENDANALAEKIAAKKAAKEAAANAGDPSARTIQPRKKKGSSGDKKKESVEDLLSAGLASGKAGKRAK